MLVYLKVESCNYYQENYKLLQGGKYGKPSSCIKEDYKNPMRDQILIDKQHGTPLEEVLFILTHCPLYKPDYLEEFRFLNTGIRLGVDSENIIYAGWYINENGEKIGIDADAWVVRIPDNKVGAIYTRFTLKDICIMEDDDISNNIILILKNKYGASALIKKDGFYEHKF